MLLIRQAAVYAPEYLGVRDVLVCASSKRWRNRLRESFRSVK